MARLFRVFDKTTQQFVDDFYVDNEGCVYRDITEDFLSPQSVEYPLSPMDNAVRMSFTGLYDKQDKEIFEGDVVKIVEEIGDSELSAVAFKDGAFGLTIIEIFVYLSTNG